jgi:hypothetical protein
LDEEVAKTKTQQDKWIRSEFGSLFQVAGNVDTHSETSAGDERTSIAEKSICGHFVISIFRKTMKRKRDAGKTMTFIFHKIKLLNQVALPQKVELK